MEPFFIDTGAIDLFVDPKDMRLIRFWKRFPRDTKHFLCHIVYWEYLRQFPPTGYSTGRRRFVHRVEQNGFEFLQFGRDEAEIAVKIYTGMKQRLPETKAGKLRLKDMHCDIMIAAIAVLHKKPVLTQDIQDWADIRLVVEADNIGRLRVSDHRDICG